MCRFHCGCIRLIQVLQVHLILQKKKNMFFNCIQLNKRVAKNVHLIRVWVMKNVFSKNMYFMLSLAIPHPLHLISLLPMIFRKAWLWRVGILSRATFYTPKINFWRHTFHPLFFLYIEKNPPLPPFYALPWLLCRWIWSNVGHFAQSSKPIYLVH